MDMKKAEPMCFAFLLYFFLQKKKGPCRPCRLCGAWQHCLNSVAQLVGCTHIENRPLEGGLVLFFFFDKLGISTYINRGIYPVQKNLGFTLIELLVVVLIISILSAVALPQYEVAVEKARLAKVMPMVKSLKDSAEVYYMANGEYKDEASTLAIDGLPGCTEKAVGHVSCPDSWFNMLTNTPGLYNVGGYSGKEGQARLGYQLGLDHGPHAGMIWCLSVQNDVVANRVCKSMGGTVFGSGSEGGMKGGAVTVYRLNP